MRLCWPGLSHRRPDHLRAGLILAALSLAALTACGGKDGVDSDLGDTSFSAIDAEIFVPSCGFGSCHGAGAGGLTLDGTDDHSQLVNMPATGDDTQTLVIPGDADGSYLIMKMEGASGIVGDPMPPPAGGLDANSIARVRAWIDAGAPSD